jgi:protein-disulfide isomerase
MVLKKKFFINRRAAIISFIGFSAYPSICFSDQSNDLNYMMRPHFIGSENAPIKIKEYFSLTCGHCATFHKSTLPKLKEKYIDSGKVQIEFIDYPLDRLAVIAASLARTLPNDGYIEAIDILLKKQKQWAYSNKPLEELLSISKLFGISSKNFKKIIANIPLMQKIVDKMEKESKKFEIESTPTFIINNEHKISGALSFKEFEKKLLTFVKSQNS